MRPLSLSVVLICLLTAALHANEAVKPAVLFDGRNTYVLAPDSESLSEVTRDRAMSISAWVKVDSKQRGGILAKRGSTDDWTPHYLLEVNRYEPGEVRFSIDDGSTRAEILHTALSERFGEWVLLTAVWDGDQLRLYVDGEEVASADASGVEGWTNAGSRLSIGAHHMEEPGQSSHFGGAIRDARVYDRALADDDAQQLFEQQDVRSGLVGHWPIDGQITDTSDHANHATLFAPGSAAGEDEAAKPMDTGARTVDVYDRLLAVRVERLNDGEPVLTRDHFTEEGAPGRDGGNINGPSVIRVPDWIPTHERPAEEAAYYMYFAHHGGRYIRLAWAADPVGPWHLFNTGDAVDRSLGDPSQDIAPRQTPGRGVVDLDLGDSDRIDTGSFDLRSHIASPDVRIDHENQRLVMYLHAPSSAGGQQTFVTTSRYGLNFNQPDEGGEQVAGERHGFRDVIPGIFYFRTFEVAGRAFAYANVARFYRGPAETADGEPATLANADDEGGLWNPGEDDDRAAYWEEIADEHNPIREVYRRMGRTPESDLHGGLWDPRHFAIVHDEDVDPDRIFFLYTARNDKPERIMLTVADLSGLSDAERADPANWKLHDPPQQAILEPALPWEGTDLELTVSSNGSATGVRELRDPFLFRDDDGRMFLYYTGRGEEAIGVASFEIID